MKVFGNEGENKGVFWEECKRTSLLCKGSKNYFSYMKNILCVRLKYFLTEHLPHFTCHMTIPHLSCLLFNELVLEYFLIYIYICSDVHFCHQLRFPPSLLPLQVFNMQLSKASVFFHEHNLLVLLH